MSVTATALQAAYSMFRLAYSRAISCLRKITGTYKVAMGLFTVLHNTMHTSPLCLNLAAALLPA